MDSNHTPAGRPQPARPERYTAPRLVRWGTLRELTQGGGGTKREPGPGGTFTRF